MKTTHDYNYTSTPFSVALTSTCSLILAEEHKSLTHVQASMMFKLVVARGINSACLLFIITEYTKRFEEKALVQVEDAPSLGRQSATRW